MTFDEFECKWDIAVEEYIKDTRMRIIRNNNIGYFSNCALYPFVYGGCRKCSIDKYCGWIIEEFFDHGTHVVRKLAYFNCAIKELHNYNCKEIYNRREYML